MAWTDDRIATLKRMWDEGYTATEIAEELGGVSRNAVIGKAHRSGLRSRPSRDDGDWSISDPILDVAGASTLVSALLAWRWPSGGRRYVGRDVTRVLELASRAAQIDPNGQSTITAADLVEATIWTALSPNPSDLLKKVASHFLLAGIGPSRRMREAETVNPVKPEDALLRWDAVAILIECAQIRERVMVGTGASQYSHLIAALASSPIAARALSEKHAGGLSSEAFRHATLEILRDDEIRQGDSAAWDAEIARIASIQASTGERRAGYASDRVTAGSDIFGAAQDARALADLITLKAAAPPLAISIFGAWGSGKSTLIAELKREVAMQVDAERQRRIADVIEEDGLAKISGVMQLEFNAWTFADSANLWASLTAELFDQIAAGGSDHMSGAVGTKLVAEVAMRTGREAGELTLAKMQLEASADTIAAAERELKRAEQNASGAVLTALADSFSEMLGIGKSKSGPAKAVADDKQQSETDEQTNETPESDTIDDKATAGEAIRRALLISERQSGAQIVLGYAKSGTAGASFLVFVWAWLFSPNGRKSVLRTVAVTIVAAAVWLVAAPVFAWVAPWMRWTASIIFVLAPTLLAVFSVVLPILRGAGIMREKLVKARERNEETVRTAKKRLIESQKNMNDAKAILARSDGLAERFGTIADPGSPPPDLMLDYLLKDSADVAALRGRLGTLGTVRRCFEQLNAIIGRMNSQDPDSPVQRIIIYIDDLDRCSEIQVVQVLEAIHLLLAFPCFVVVAAVDARWLRHSLTAQYEALNGVQGGMDPADYLEKIFQVPFWVRPISGSRSSGKAAYSDYIRTLLWTGPAKPAPTESGDRDDPDIGQQNDFPRLAPARPSNEEKEAGAHRHLTLSEQEIQLLTDMQPIAARSPRAVKRMVNIYRLLRVSIPEPFVEDFMTDGRHVPPYWAVILLLACEVGLPSSEMTSLAIRLRGLEADEMEALAEMGQVSYGKPDSPHAAPKNSVISDLVDSPGGRSFLLGLRAVAEAGVSIEATKLQTALDLIGRYSFRAD